MTVSSKAESIDDAVPLSFKSTESRSTKFRTELYDLVQPYRTGALDVGDGHNVYWEESGDPEGKV